MPNPPASSALPLSQIPSWGEVESDPQFVAADKPTQLAAFNNWRNMLLDASLGDENAFTREDFDRFQVFSRRKAAELSGSPTWQQDADRSVEQYRAEEEARQKLLQDSLSRKPLAPLTEAATLGFDLAQAAASPAAGALAQLPGMVEGLIAAPEEKERDTLRKVFQDEEDFAVFNGRFVASPSLVLDRDKYKKAVAESSLDRDAKIRAMAELGELRDQVAASVSDNMLKTESTYGEGLIGIGNDFTKMRDYELSRNPQATEADIVEKWRKQNDHWWKNPMKQTFLGARMAGTSLVQQYYGLKSLAGLADEMDENRLTAATQQLGELGEASKNIGGATLASQASNQVLQMAPLVALGPVGRGAGALVSGAAARTAARAGFALTGRAASSLASGAVSRVGLQLPRIRALLAEKQTAGQIAKTLGLAEAEVAPVAKMLLREQAIHSAGGQAAVVLASGLQAAGSSYPEIRDQVLSDLSSTLDKEDPEYEAKLAQAEKTAVDTATYQALRRGFVTMAVTWAGNKLGGDTGEAALAGSGTLRGVSRGTAKALKDNFAVYLFKTAGKEVVPEAIEEASDSLVNGLVDKMTYDPNRSIGDIAADVFESGAWGGFLGGFFGGVKAAANYSAEKQAALRAKPVADLLSASKGLEETGSPQTAAELRKQAGELAERTAAARLAAGLAPVEEAPPPAPAPRAATRPGEAPTAATPPPVEEAPPPAPAPRAATRPGEAPTPVEEVPPPAPAPRAATRPSGAPTAATPPPVEEAPPPAPAPRAATRPGPDLRTLAKTKLLTLAKSQPVGTKFIDYRGDVWEKVPDGWTLTSKQFADAMGVETTRPMADEVAIMDLRDQLLSAPAPVEEVPPPAPAPRAATRPGEAPTPIAEAPLPAPALTSRAATQTANGKKRGDKIVEGENIEVLTEDDQSTPGMPPELTVLEVDGILDSKSNKVFARRRDMTPDEITVVQEKIRQRNALAKEMGMPQIEVPQPITPQGTPTSATEGPTPTTPPQTPTTNESQAAPVEAAPVPPPPRPPRRPPPPVEAPLTEEQAQDVTERKEDLDPEIDTAISESLTEEEKTTVVQELGASAWGPEVVSSFKKALADWSIGAIQVSARLAAIFQKVLNSARATIVALGIFVGSSVNTSTGLIPVETLKENLPVMNIVEDMAALDRQISEGLATPSGEAAAVRLAPPAAVTELPSIAPAVQGVSSAELPPLRAGEIALPTTVKQANFRGTAASNNAKLTANWIVYKGDNGGKPFIIGDKTDGALFVFDKDGNLIRKTPALFGMNVGDQLPTDPDTERVTPSGRFESTIDYGVEYYGTTLDFYQTEISGSLSIHKVYLAEPEERRQQRINSRTPADNRISYGCVNVDEQVFNRDVAPAFADGGIVYILPETQVGRAKFAPLAEQAPAETFGVELPTAAAVAETAPTTQTPTPTTPDASIQRNIPEDRQQERIQTDEGRQAAETGGGNRPLVSGQVEGQAQGQAENVTPIRIQSAADALQEKAAEMNSRLSSLETDSAESLALQEEVLRVEATVRAMEDSQAPASEKELSQSLPEVKGEPAEKKIKKLFDEQKARPVAKSRLALIGFAKDQVKAFNNRAEAEQAFGQALPPGKYGVVVPTEDTVHLVLFADDLAEEGAPGINDVLFHEAVHFAEEQMLRSNVDSRPREEQQLNPSEGTLLAESYDSALRLVRDPITGGALASEMERIYPGYSKLESDEAKLAEVVTAILEGKLTKDPTGRGFLEQALKSTDIVAQKNFTYYLRKFLEFLNSLITGDTRPNLTDLVTYSETLAKFIGELESTGLKALPRGGAVERPAMFAARKPTPMPRQSPEVQRRISDLQKQVLAAQSVLEDPQRDPRERDTALRIYQALSEEIATLSRPNAISAPKSNIEAAAEFATDGIDTPVRETAPPPAWTYEGDTRPEELRKIDAYVVPDFVNHTVDRGLVQWSWENGRAVVKVNLKAVQEKIRKKRMIVAAKLRIPTKNLKLEVDVTYDRSFAEAVATRIQEEYQSRYPAEASRPTSLWTLGRVEGQSPKLVRQDPSKLEASERRKVFGEGLFPTINRKIPADPAAATRTPRELGQPEKEELKKRAFWPLLTEEEGQKEQDLRQAAEAAKNKQAAAKLRKAADQMLADAASRKFSAVVPEAGKGSALLDGALEKSPVHSLPEGTKLYRVISTHEQAPRKGDLAGAYYALRPEGTLDQIMPTQHVTTDLAEAKAHAKRVGGKVMEVRSNQVRKLGNNLFVPGGTFEVVQRSGGTFIIQHLEGAPKVLRQGFFTNTPEITAMQISKGYSVFVPTEIGDAVHPHIEYNPKTRMVTGVKVAALGNDVFISVSDGPDAYASKWEARQPTAQKATKIINEVSALEKESGISAREARDQLREANQRVRSLELNLNQTLKETVATVDVPEGLSPEQSVALAEGQVAARRNYARKALAEAKKEQRRLRKLVKGFDKLFPVNIPAEREENIVSPPDDIQDPAEREAFDTEESALYQRASEFMEAKEAELLSRHPALAAEITTQRVYAAVMQSAINIFRQKKGAIRVDLNLVLTGVLNDFYALKKKTDPLGGEPLTTSQEDRAEDSVMALLSGEEVAAEVSDTEAEPLTNDEKSLLGTALANRVLDGEPERTFRMLSRGDATDEEIATARQILELHRRGADFTVAAESGEVTMTYGAELNEDEMAAVEELLPKVAELQFSSQTARRFPNLARILIKLHDEAVTALLEIQFEGSPVYKPADIKQMSLREMITIAKNTSATGMLEYLDIVRYEVATTTGIDSPFLAAPVEGLPTAQEALAQIQEDLRRPDLSPEDRQRLEQERETLTKTIENAKTLQAARLRGKRLAEQANFDELRNNLRSLLGPMFDMPADPETPRFSKEALQRFREELQRFGVDVTNWRDDNESSMTLSPQSSRRLFNYFRLQFKGANKALTSALAELIETINAQFEVVISTVANGNTSDPVTWVGTQLFVDLNAFPIPADGDTARVMEQFALHVQQAVLQRMTREALDRALGGAFAKAESIGEGSHPTLKALEELRAEAERVLGEDFPRETSTVREFVLSLYNSPTFVRALNEQKAAGGTGFKGLLSRVSRFIAQLLMDFLNPAAKIKVNLGSVYHTAVVESLRLMSLSPSNGVKTAALLNKLFFVPESGTPVVAEVVKATSPVIAAAANETQEDTSNTGDEPLEEIIETVTNDEVPVSGPQTSSPGTNPNASVVLKPSGAPPALPAQREAALGLVTSILEEVDSNTPLEATVAPEGTGLTLWVTGNRDSNVIHVDVNNLAQVVTEWRTAGMSEADIKRRLRAGLEEEVDHLEIHRRFSDTDLIRIGLGMDPAERRNLARSIAGPDASPAEVARAAGDGPNMTPLEQAKAMAILADEYLRRTRQRVRSGFTTEDVRAITKTEPRSLNRVLAYLTAYFRRVAARWNASADPVSLRAALNTASFLSANGMTVDQITGGIPDIADRLIATAAASTAYGDARFGTAQRTKKDLESGMFDGAAKDVREAMEALADMEVDYDSLTEPELIKRAGDLVEKHTVSGPMTGDDMKALTAKIRDDVSEPERVRHVAKNIVLKMTTQAAIKATDPDVKANFRAAEAAILVEVTKEASAFGANLRSVQTAQDKILDPHRAVATYGTSFIRGTKATLKTMGVDKIVEEIERELGDPAKISGGVVDGVVGEDVRKASVKAKAKKKGVSDKDIAEAEQEAVELEDASRLPLDDLAEAVAKAMLERVSKRLRGRLSPAEEDALFKQILAEVSRQIISRLSDGDPDKKKPVRRTVWTRFLENAEDIDILEKAFDASTEKLRRELAPGGNPNFNGPPTQEQVDKLTRTLALLEGARAEVLPMKDARKLVRQSFRFREEVKAHVSDQLASVASLTKMLVEVGELDETQAKLVAKYIEIAYEEEKAKYIQKLIERYKRSDLAASASTVVDKLSRSEELAQFARMGAFRSEEFYSAIARSLELPTYDTKVVEQLEADLAAINAMPKDSIQRLDAGRELSSKVADLILKQLVSSNSLKGLLQKHPEVLWTYLVEVPTSMWKAGILSGFGTQQVNLVFGSLQSIMDLTNNAVGYAMTAPKGTRASLMARNLFTMFKSALLLDPATRAETITEMKRALFTGSTRFQSEQTESLSRLERDLPLVGKITKPYSLLGRVMMVIDALVGVPANMARQRMAIAHLATKQGYDADQMRELLSKAFSPEETVMRQIENQLDGEASSFALSKNPALMREARRNELLEQYRDSLAKNLSAGADIITEGRISANVANLSSQPKGFAGWVMDGIFGSLERKTRGATSLLVPFARSLANMLDFSLAMSFFPVSFLRAYNMSPSSWMPDSMISETYRRQQVERGSQEFYKLMSQGFMSTFLTAGLAMAVFEMFRAMADDEEPFIAVYGDGPADSEKRNQLRLRAPFWKPNVLKIGSFYANWKDLPGINLLLGGIAALSDSVINAQEKGRKVRPSQFAVNSMIQLTRAMFAKQPLQGLEDASKLLFGRAEGGASLDKVLMKMASSWVGGVTNPRILRDVEDMTRGLLSETGETPMIETAKTWSDALQSVLPGSSLIFDRPAILNARGKEVTSFWFAPFTKRLLPDMESPHTDEIITPLVSAGLYLSPPESQMSFKTWKDPEDRAAGIDPDGAILSSFDSDVAREALILYGEQMTAMLQNGNVINNLVRFAERGQVEREAAQKALDSISSAARKYAQSKLQRRILDGELLPHWQQ